MMSTYVYKDYYYFKNHFLDLVRVVEKISGEIFPHFHLSPSTIN